MKMMMMMSVNSPSIGAILVHILSMAILLKYYGCIKNVRFMVKRTLLDNNYSKVKLLKYFPEYIVILLQYGNLYYFSVIK